MKGRLTFLLVAIIAFQLSYAQGWEWKIPVSVPMKIVKDNSSQLYAYYTGTNQFVLEKYSTTGNLLWTKTINGPVDVKSVRVDGANNLVILGNITGPATVDAYTLTPAGSTSFFILRVSSSSAVLSANVYGNSNEVFANSLFITTAGNFLIGGGCVGSFSMNSYLIPGDTMRTGFLICTDASQNVMWADKSGQYSGSDAGWVEEAAQTSGGNYFVVLYTGPQKYIYYLNAARQVVSSAYIEYMGLGWFHPYELSVLGENAYMKDFYGHQTAVGNIDRWDNGCNHTDYGWLSDGVGYNVYNGKVYTSKVVMDKYTVATKWWFDLTTHNPDLSVWKQYTDTLPGEAYYHDLQVIDTTSFYISGSISGWSEFIGKYSLALSVGIKKEKAEEAFAIFPNPAATELHIRTNAVGQINIYNTMGVLIKTKSISHKDVIDISGLPASVYTLEFISQGERSYTHFVKE